MEQTDGTADLPEAHIGMLRNHHTYSADIPVTHTLGADVVATHPQHNIYFRVLSLSPTTKLEQATPNGDGYSNTLTVEVKTVREGRIAESVELISEVDDTSTKVIRLSATVLLSNQGNPLLKDGVHMVSHEHQDESDFTEWPGHGKEP